MPDDLDSISMNTKKTKLVYSELSTESTNLFARKEDQGESPRK
jgi:hypothetical protein